MPQAGKPDMVSFARINPTPITAHDRLGRALTVTDQRGVAHTYSYDSAGSPGGGWSVRSAAGGTERAFPRAAQRRPSEKDPPARPGPTKAGIIWVASPGFPGFPQVSPGFLGSVPRFQKSPDISESTVL